MTEPLIVHHLKVMIVLQRCVLLATPTAKLSNVQLLTSVTLVNVTMDFFSMETPVQHVLLDVKRVVPLELINVHRA